MAKNRGYKTPNEKFDAEFAELGSNPVQQKVKSAGTSGMAQSTGYKTPNEKFDEEFADLSGQPVKKKVQQSKAQKQTK
ncbi:hypothetical protein [Paenibacillus physcomitrellae]|uniref:Uncharacterized protein n=1 Tax=Paenibacillus physcomitrellae TaxID=1619311 RepID=A0ABQ1G7Q4_9BACL|nr:hypothetical protein [Paenibacillus physcomitrellae]GGA38385.1 hypothetical protein GCM10010917_24600 [Paenibacillus physcomitrellae]